MDIPAELLIHQVTVETYAGTGAYGDTYAAPVTRPVFVEDSRRLVRTPDGDEVISETTIYAAPSDVTTLTEKSKVILPSGRSTIVLLVKNHDDGNLGAPQHVEVACQ